MKEQDAAHSFEADFHVTKEQFKAIKEADVIRLTDGQEYIKKEVAAGIMKSYTEDLRAELTRLRSELQDTKSYYENKLDARQRIIDRQFSELQQKDEVIKELMRFAFEVRNSTNLNQDGKVKVIKINSIIERATKILKQS